MSNPSFERPVDVNRLTAEQQAQDAQLSNLHELSISAFQMAEQVPDNDAAQLESIYMAGNLLAESVGSSSSGVEPLRTAQEALEMGHTHGDQMGEAARELAVQLNQAERSQKGLPPLSFEQALEELSAEASSNRTSEHEAIKQEGLSMGYFASSLRRSPSVSTCNDALRIIETRLQEYAQAPDKTPLHHEQVDTWRAQRDALWQKRAELLAEQRTTEREAAEKPAHDAAVEQARQQVAESLGQKPETSSAGPEVLDRAKTQANQATPAQVELGNRLSQVVNDLRDGNVPRRFTGLQELSDEKRTILTNELQEVRKKFMGLGADKRPYRDALDKLVTRYTSGEMFPKDRDN